MLKKAVTYVRVSTKEQQDQGYSPEAQKRLLWTFARGNGFDVAEEFEDTESAKEAGRAAFNQMLTYVRKHDIKHILVEKTDRLHRNFRDYVLIEDLTRDCDVTVHFVKEGVSIGRDAPSSQKFMHGVRTLMAKNFIDNLREETTKGMDEKVMLGEYPSKAPLGYLNVRNPETKKSMIVVDEKNRPLVQALFRRYSTGGYSLLSLIEEVEGEGLARNLPHGSRLNKTTVAHVLQSCFYTGNFLWKKQVRKGTHESLVDMKLWEKAQDVLHGRSLNRKDKKHNRIPFTYKGLFSCGECSRCITAEIKKGRYVYYRCTKYEKQCSQPAVKEEIITAESKKLLGTLDISDNGINFLVAGLKLSLEDKRNLHDGLYEDLVKEHALLNSRLDRMYEDHLDQKITDQFYNQKFAEYKTRLAALETKVAKHDRANINYYEFGHRILELAKNAGMLFENGSPEEKQEFMRYVLSNSTLKDKIPDFKLKIPFSTIAKRSPLRECSTWGG